MPIPRLRQVNRQQIVPAIELDQLVAPDHPVRSIWEYVTALDLTPLLANIQAVEGRPGRNATDPKILLALWLWAISQGVGTARAIAELCDEHHAYRWLAGGVTLNYHTLASFRSGHVEAFEQFLEAHVAALLQQQIIELVCVAQDGLRTRASAAAGSFRRRTSIEQCQEQVRAQIEQLTRHPGEAVDAVSRRQQAARQRHARERHQRLAQARQVAVELQAKQDQRAQQHPKEAAQRPGRPPRASTTDPESRRMKMADGGTRPAYNLQCATTADTGIIVATAVTNQGNDSGLLGPMLQQIEATYHRLPEQVLVDGGFCSTEDVEAAQARGIAVYMPLKNERRDLAQGKNPYRPKRRDGPGMAALRRRMETATAKQLYKKRAASAEWVYARMRHWGLTRLTVRGSARVRGVLALQALVHNIRQTEYLLRGRARVGRWQALLRAGRA